MACGSGTSVLAAMYCMSLALAVIPPVKRRHCEVNCNRGNEILLAAKMLR